jgi:hypothetical protein
MWSAAKKQTSSAEGFLTSSVKMAARLICEEAGNIKAL